MVRIKKITTEKTEKKLINHRFSQIYTGLPNLTPFFIYFFKKLKTGIWDSVSGILTNHRGYGEIIMKKTKSTERNG
jgi:hypothetical protein